MPGFKAHFGGSQVLSLARAVYRENLLLDALQQAGLDQRFPADGIVDSQDADYVHQFSCYTM